MPAVVGAVDNRVVGHALLFHRSNPWLTSAFLDADWPVLHEGDGGREVHALHVALERAGFYPSGKEVLPVQSDGLGAAQAVLLVDVPPWQLRT